MCTGIAITLSEVPDAIVDACQDRVYTREVRQELQFHWIQNPTVLPVWWDGAIRLLRWGSRDRRSRLPYGGWIARDRLKEGHLADVRCEEVLIPANMGNHRGTWFLIEEGLVGVVIPETPDGPVVYMLTEPPSNYYRNMTAQAPFMPIFVNQVI